MKMNETVNKGEMDMTFTNVLDNTVSEKNRIWSFSSQVVIQNVEFTILY